MEAKVRQIVTSSVGILLSVGCLISFYIAVFGTLDNGAVQYLITKLASIPISLYSTLRLVKFIDRNKISVTKNGKVLIVLFYALSFILSSVMMFSNAVLHSIDLIRVLTKYDMRSAENDQNRAECYKRIFMRSEARAVARILDDSDRGDIILDDGIVIKRYRQIALINLDGARYALLSPHGKSHLSKSFAHAFLIGSYPDTDSPSLTPVTDDGLYDRIYEQYKLLLEHEFN